MMDKFEFEGGEEMMEAPMMEGEKEAEAPIVKTNVLAVLASKDDDFVPWDKIVTSGSFTDNDDAKYFSMTSTTYENFLDGKKEDTFDFVLLVFMGAISSDDLEMKQDYYDYYTQVPIVHFAFAKKA